jgi:hypothetical protein
MTLWMRIIALNAEAQLSPPVWSVIYISLIHSPSALQYVWHKRFYSFFGIVRGLPYGVTD